MEPNQRFGENQVKKILMEESLMLNQFLQRDPQVKVS